MTTVLSELRRGTLYRIVADEVDAVLQVIEPGKFPLCIMAGVANCYVEGNDDETEIVTVQLIGWTVSGRDMRTTKGLQLYHADVEPEGGAWLLGVRIGQDFCPKPMLLALAPEISEVPNTD